MEYNTKKFAEKIIQHRRWQFEKVFRFCRRKDNDKVLTLQFKLDGENRILFTGSNVLMEQIGKYKDEIPFLTKIEKVNKFYTFT